MEEEIKNNNGENKRGERIQIAFLVLLALAIVCMIFAGIVLVKNAKMFATNPIAFGIDKYELDSCVCYHGVESVEVYKEGFRNKVQELNVEDLNIGPKGSDTSFAKE
jgi:hypothetical protein